MVKKSRLNSGNLSSRRGKPSAVKGINKVRLSWSDDQVRGQGTPGHLVPHGESHTFPKFCGLH